MFDEEGSPDNQKSPLWYQQLSLSPKNLVRSTLHLELASNVVPLTSWQRIASWLSCCQDPAQTVDIIGWTVTLCHQGRPVPNIPLPPKKNSLELLSLLLEAGAVLWGNGRLKIVLYDDRSLTAFAPNTVIKITMEVPKLDVQIVTVILNTGAAWFKLFAQISLSQISFMALMANPSLSDSLRVDN